ncbi:MAG TPA: phospho-N-acetylmuramoyl-pentapeptide-transferase [Alphaproteobacteria bacterium]
MLYHLLTPLADDFQFFNLFNYLTFRSGGAMITALLIALFCGAPFIRLLKRIQGGGQPIRTDGPETHLKKAGTPTMGGLLILFSSLVSILLWVRLDNPYVWIVLMVMLTFGAVGFADDFAKLTKRSHRGVSGRTRSICLTIVSLGAAYMITQVTKDSLSTGLTIPFFKNVLIPLGGFFFIWVVLVVVGAANAVNITDGLDGLAAGTVMIALACFSLITYLVSNVVFSNYLQLHHVAGSGDVAIIAAALIGGCLGFLWYNAPPAQIFMGDTGSLALGGTLGTIAVITKHEFVLAIIGGLFVMETLSVMIQVFYFKATGGKRFFKMAPLHHHFEKSGWPETTVFIRFMIIALVFALLGLSTLKLR